ncbi:hypothetical protein J437_LFUL000608 [Ladona fulva]|uniref:Uncharacterized protein n=1 Tax=Ladona fulva TaxID=123851 RepID=A0A8K0K9P9_LADFU|nr:hypothetical protein J437_LFUL000608 [Ladona fulva]
MTACWWYLQRTPRVSQQGDCYSVELTVDNVTTPLIVPSISAPPHAEEKPGTSKKENTPQKKATPVN